MNISHISTNHVRGFLYSNHAIVIPPEKTGRELFNILYNNRRVFIVTAPHTIDWLVHK